MVGGGEEAETAVGYPIEFEQGDEIEVAPDTGAHEGAQAVVTVAPVGGEGEVAHDDVRQKGHPHLPLNRVFAVA